MIYLSLKLLKVTALSRPSGYLDDVLSNATVDGDTVKLEYKNYYELLKKYNEYNKKHIDPRLTFSGDGSVKISGEKTLLNGPGTELKKLLAKIGIVAKPNCSCNVRALTMDKNEYKEPGWCEKNVETICDWLQEEANKRKLPFLRSAGKILIRRAISNYKKNKQ